MKAGVLTILSLATIFCCVAQEKRKPKPGEVEVVELQARRGEERVTLDGRLKNTGELPIVGLRLTIYFISPDEKVVSTKQGSVETPSLGPGEETEFHLETTAPARAVSLRIEAISKGENEVKMTPPGPFPIE
jgi:hypothetical protein